MVTDIKSYSPHTAPEHSDAQRRLRQVLEFACRHAGILRVRTADRQDRGDGRLYVLPPRMDDTLAIPRLLIGLRHGLYLANAEPGPFGRIRLRAAMARGAIARGATGYLGQAPITASRLVDSAQLRDGLDGADSADLAFMAPDDLYQDVIKQDFPGLSSGEFTRVDVQMKEYSGTAWIYLPAAGPALAPGQSDALWDSVIAGAAAGVLAWSVIAHPDPASDADDDEDFGGDIAGWPQETGWPQGPGNLESDDQDSAEDSDAGSDDLDLPDDDDDPWDDGL